MESIWGRFADMVNRTSVPITVQTLVALYIETYNHSADYFGVPHLGLAPADVFTPVEMEVILYIFKQADNSMYNAVAEELEGLGY